MKYLVIGALLTSSMVFLASCKGKPFEDPAYVLTLVYNNKSSTRIELEAVFELDNNVSESKLIVIESGESYQESYDLIFESSEGTIEAASRLVIRTSSSEILCDDLPVDTSFRACLASLGEITETRSENGLTKTIMFSNQTLNQ